MQSEKRGHLESKSSTDDSDTNSGSSEEDFSASGGNGSRGALGALVERSFSLHDVTFPKMRVTWGHMSAFPLASD